MRFAIVPFVFVVFAAAAPLQSAPASTVNGGANFVPDLLLFPFAHGHYACSEALLKWIESKVGSMDVSCDRYSLFGMGFTEEKTLLMEAGVGCYPYIAVTKGGVPMLRVAVTLPYLDGEQTLKEIRFVADQDVRVVPITSETRTLESQMDSTTLLTLDLSTDVLTLPFLRQLAAAKERFMLIGENGKRKLKIGKRNARSIEELTRLYEAIGESRDK